jgi:hypothetical protein
MAVRTWLVLLVAVPVLTRAPPYGDDPASSSLMASPITLVALQLSVIAAVLIGMVRHRSLRTTITKLEFSWRDYLPVCLVVVVFHVALAHAAQGFHDQLVAAVGVADALRTGSSVWLAVVGVQVIVLFAASQITTGSIIRCLNRALSDDLLLEEHNAHRRNYIFALAAAPVAVCLVPSMMYLTLVGGVAFRLMLLALAWRYTELSSPAGVIRTLRAVRAHRSAPTRGRTRRETASCGSSAA